MNTVDNQISRLERRLACVATANVALLLGMLVLFLSGFLQHPEAEQKSRVIEAEQLIIRDRAGLIRATLGPVDPRNPSTEFRLYDGDGRRMVVLVAESGGPDFQLFNEDGKNLVWIGTSAEESFISVVHPAHPGNKMLLGAGDRGGYLSLFRREQKDGISSLVQTVRLPAENER